LQSYRENDKNEELYTCVFAGRSVVNSNLIPSENDDDDDHHHHTDKARELITESATPDEWTGTFQHWPLVHCTGSGGQLFCVGGKKGIIKILDLAQQKYVGFLRGHGKAIFDLKVSPVDEQILISASEDRSFRIWNLQTGACAAICAGLRAHQDSVLSVAWNHDATWIASASHDTTVRIWKAGPGSIVSEAIRQSHRDFRAWQEEQVMRNGPPFELSM
jgi:WD40 repeat protein